MDVRGVKRVARAALRQLMRAVEGLALRVTLAERPIEQIASEHQSYFRKSRRPVPGGSSDRSQIQ